MNSMQKIGKTTKKMLKFDEICTQNSKLSAGEDIFQANFKKQPATWPRVALFLIKTFKNSITKPQVLEKHKLKCKLQVQLNVKLNSSRFEFGFELKLSRDLS